MIELPRLYAIADSSFGNPVELARELFAGGARLLQVRNKQAGAGELLAQTRAILRLAPADAIVIVNDRADVAWLGGAAGVHLGQEDLPARAARQVLGPDRIVGYSTHDEDQASPADDLPVDYVAVGPIFPTATKEKPGPVVGLERLERICRMMRKPVVAIGGITLETVPAVFAAGARSVTVISDLLGRGDVTRRTREFLRVC